MDMRMIKRMGSDGRLHSTLCGQVWVTKPRKSTPLQVLDFRLIASSDPTR
jgi:hypothetical protein